MNVAMVGPADAVAAAERVRASSRVAVDTEFHAENRYLPDLYLVQLGLDDGTCLIVDPLVPGVLDRVGAALRERPWVVHGGEHDVRILSWVLGGPPAGPVFDTQIAAGLCTPSFPTGYATLCEDWLGVRVDKGETLSDWSRRPLSRAQLEYAARDVLHLFPLADAIAARLDGLGRSQAAALACAEAVDAVLDPTADRWLTDVAGSSSLEPRQCAVLRALLVWREERARAQNQPPRAVASDAILLDVARRLPGSAVELTSSRRFPKNVARFAPELVQIAAAALATPEDTWPVLVRRATADARRSSFLQLWAQVEGQRAAWAQALVLPARLADRVVIAGPGALPAWRRDLVGDSLERAIRGEITLRLGSGDVTAGSGER